MKIFHNAGRMIHNIKMDFSRYGVSFNNPIILFVKLFHNPGMIFSFFYRVERFLLYESDHVLKPLGLLLYPLYFFITYFILGYHIEPKAEIAGGLHLHNRDIVITDFVSIGENVSIMGQTTIGTDFVAKNVLICIGNNVKIGAGAKIISKGKLLIAHNVVIGANAVVTKSIHEEGATYVGVPAKKVRH